jgi:hypothetical protein
MGKVSELSMLLDEIRKCSSDLNNIADELSNIFSGEAVSDKKEYTLEEVRSVLAKKSQSGHTAEVKALLTKYGVDKLSAVDPSKYEALLKDAEDIKDE